MIYMWTCESYFLIRSFRLGGHYSPKNDPKSHFWHVINRFPEMPGPILLKLGMLVVHVGLLMYAIFVRDLIRNGRLAAILFFAFAFWSVFLRRFASKWLRWRSMIIYMCTWSYFLIRSVLVIWGPFYFQEWTIITFLTCHQPFFGNVWADFIQT